MESFHLVPMTAAGQAEIGKADRVPPAVLNTLAAHYTPAEVAEVLGGIDSVHRKRRALAGFRELRRHGIKGESAILEVADSVGRSESWVRGVVYGNND